MATRQVTSFALGFLDEGINGQEVGVDIVSLYSAPETWTADDDGEKEVGTPVQIDITGDRVLKICPDGEVPNGFLQNRVGNSYDGVKDYIYKVRNRKEIVAGDPAPFVRMRAYGVLDTSLFVEGYTPDVGDEVIVRSGAFDGDKAIDTKLTGTVEVAAESLGAVAGTGTSFESELEVGDTIKVGGIEKVVEAITSDTALAVSVDFDEAIAAETDIFVVRDGDAIGTIYETNTFDGATFAWIVLNEKTRG